MDYINHIIQVILKNFVSIKRNILEIKIIANYESSNDWKCF